jgi:hypothetical protein
LYRNQTDRLPRQARVNTQGKKNNNGGVLLRLGVYYELKPQAIETRPEDFTTYLTQTVGFELLETLLPSLGACVRHFVPR